MSEVFRFVLDADSLIHSKRQHTRSISVPAFGMLCSKRLALIVSKRPEVRGG